MALPNLIALILLAPVVAKTSEEFFAKKDKGKNSPA
jgi:Na+/alanine symporter